MANEENTNVTEQAKGLPPGVTKADLSDSDLGTGNPVPKVNNDAPVKEPTAEEKAATEATAKAEADSKVNADTTTTDQTEADKVKTEEFPTEYKKYNNETVDSAIAILEEAKVPPKEAEAIFAEAVKSLDVSKLDVKKLTELVGAPKANLIVNGMKQFFNDYHEKVTVKTNAVYEVAGGKENFDKVSVWAQAKEKIDPEFAGALVAYRQMIDSSPVAAKLASAELVKAYNADPKNKSLEVKIFEGNKPANQGNVKGISRADYVTELKKAEETGNNPRKAELHNLRRLGKEQGI